MEYSKIQKNRQGYQTTFKCKVCGKIFDLNELRYFDGDRVCLGCINDYQNSLREEAKKIIVHFSAEGLDDEEDETEVEEY